MTAATQGQYGTVTFSAGSVSYAPLGSFAGDDQFTYTVADSLGAVATAKVTVRQAAAGSGPRPSVAVQSGGGAPRAGEIGGPPAGTKMTGFGPPALSDSRQLASTVTLLAGRTALTGILFIDESARPACPLSPARARPAWRRPAPSSRAFPIPSFRRKARWPSSRKRRRRGCTAWSRRASGPRLHERWLPLAHLARGEHRDRRRLARGLQADRHHERRSHRRRALRPRPALVPARRGAAAVDASGTQVLLHERALVSPGAAISKLSVLQPALGSAGHGRWTGPQGSSAKATLTDRTTALFEIAADGTVSRLLSTWQTAR